MSFNEYRHKDNLRIYIMIFRTNEGKLIQLSKYNFINDKLYYQKILEINKPLPKLENTFNYKNNKQSNK